MAELTGEETNLIILALARDKKSVQKGPMDKIEKVIRCEEIDLLIEKLRRS